MDELKALLDEWTQRGNRGLITADDYRSWKILLEAAYSQTSLPQIKKLDALIVGLPMVWSSSSPPIEVEYAKSVVSTNNSVRTLIDAISKYPTKIIQRGLEKKSLPSSKSVFLIHGHDDAVREAVARFIEKLGLDPIILFERPNGGKTIIEKLEREIERAGFAIALLTADDAAICKRDQKEETRARQNVVFEMGYFAAKLGRERVAVLKQAGVAEPSDLHGIVYTELDGKGAWKVELAKELRAAGFEIDMNKAF